MSLREDDEASAAVATAPRVSLADLEANITGENWFVASAAMTALNQPSMPVHETLTICILTCRNGFTVVGKAAPASPDNFDAEVGRKFAREDAMRHLWPLMGYALRDKLMGEKS